MTVRVSAVEKGDPLRVGGEAAHCYSFTGVHDHYRRAASGASLD